MPQIVRKAVYGLVIAVVVYRFVVPNIRRWFQVGCWVPTYLHVIALIALVTGVAGGLALRAVGEMTAAKWAILVLLLPALVYLVWIVYGGPWGMQTAEEAAYLVGYTPIDPRDSGMQRAMQQARDTMDSFAEAFRAAEAGTEGFAVRAPLEFEGYREHLWVSVTRVEGATFVGVIENEPVVVPGHSAGEEVRVERARVSDWMYVKDGRLVGGTTIRLTFSRQPKRVREKLASMLAFEMDEADAK
jgi:uncharacterized protein YegJ (DUF2314 family)